MGASKDAKLNYESQIKTNETNYQIAQETNQFNERMADKQMAFQERMWNLQNEYNDPSAQKERLEAAGLNPYLMMDGGNAGNASSSPAGASASGVAAQMVAPQMQNRAIASMEILSGIANVLKTTQDANQVFIENQYKADDMASEIQHRLASSRDTNARAYWQEVANGLSRTIWQNQATQGYLNNVSLAHTIEGQVLGNIYQRGANVFQSVEQGMQVGRYISDMLTSIASRSATKASIDRTMHEINNLIKQGGNLDIQNEMLENQRDGQSAYEKDYYQERRKVVGDIIRAELEKLQNTAGPDSPWQFGTYLRNELQKWSRDKPMTGSGYIDSSRPNERIYQPGVLW